MRHCALHRFLSLRALWSFNFSFAVLLALIMLPCDAEARNHSSSRSSIGSWLGVRNITQQIGGWLTTKSTFHNRYDNWFSISRLMENWEIALKLPRSLSTTEIEYTEPVKSLFVQVTPCSGPINVQFHSERLLRKDRRQLRHSSTVTKNTFTEHHRSNRRHFRSSGRVFYPALDSRLYGEFKTSSNPNLMWIIMSTPPSSMSRRRWPMHKRVSNDYVTVRFFKQPNINNDYPAAPQYIKPPRVKMHSTDAVLLIDLELDHYDNSIIRPMSFCVVVNNVRPLPQWCSAQIAIPQLKYNREIWAQEQSLHLKRDEFSYTCQRAIFGRSPSNMQIQLPKSSLRRRTQRANNNSIISTFEPIYLNMYSINEDPWRLATSGPSVVLNLPPTQHAELTSLENITLGYSIFNVEKVLQFIELPMAMCDCQLNIPITLTHDEDIFVMTKKARLQQPVKAQIWPFMIMYEKDWQRRQNFNQWLTLLPSLGAWMNKSSFAQSSGTSHFVAETYLLLLRSPCPPSARRKLLKVPFQCPVVKLHVGPRHGPNRSVRFIDMKSIGNAVTKCKRVTWHPILRPKQQQQQQKFKWKYNHRVRSSCLSEILQQAIVHQRVKNSQQCNRRAGDFCWSVKLVLPQGLTRIHLETLFPQPTKFTFQAIPLLPHRTSQLCPCLKLHLYECQRCLLKVQNFYRESKNLCRAPSCQHVEGVSQAMQGVTVSITRPRSKRQTNPLRAHRRGVVLLQLFAAPGDGLCDDAAVTNKMNKCFDAATLVAYRAVRAPSWLT